MKSFGYVEKSGVDKIRLPYRHASASAQVRNTFLSKTTEMLASLCKHTKNSVSQGTRKEAWKKKRAGGGEGGKRGKRIKKIKVPMFLSLPLHAT